MKEKERETEVSLHSICIGRLTGCRHGRNQMANVPVHTYMST